MRRLSGRSCFTIAGEPPRPLSLPVCSPSLLLQAFGAAHKSLPQAFGAPFPTPASIRRRVALFPTLHAWTVAAGTSWTRRAHKAQGSSQQEACESPCLSSSSLLLFVLLL